MPGAFLAIGYFVSSEEMFVPPMPILLTQTSVVRVILIAKGIDFGHLIKISKRVLLLNNFLSP
jgi:hypothetical protein